MTTEAERLIQAAAGLDGWEALDLDHPIYGQIGRAHENEAIELAELVRNVFTTPQGDKLLRRWMQAYIARPVVQPGVDAYHCGIREGENSFVRQILALMRLAEEGPPDVGRSN